MKYLYFQDHFLGLRSLIAVISHITLIIITSYSNYRSSFSMPIIWITKMNRKLLLWSFIRAYKKGLQYSLVLWISVKRRVPYFFSLNSVQCGWEKDVKKCSDMRNKVHTSNFSWGPSYLIILGITSQVTFHIQLVSCLCHKYINMDELQFLFPWFSSPYAISSITSWKINLQALNEETQRKRKISPRYNL